MRKASCRGFTLIELLTAVTIVVIVAAVAYPSYQESVRKAKRAEGRTALMQLMQQQERYYSQHSRYVPFSSSSAEPQAKQFRWYSAESPQKSAYEISGAACADEQIETCIALTATPGTGNVDSSFTDTKCGKLMFFSTGRKAADDTDCW